MSDGLRKATVYDDAAKSVAEAAGSVSAKLRGFMKKGSTV
jgi:hypothetical protein